MNQKIIEEMVDYLRSLGYLIYEPGYKMPKIAHIKQKGFSKSQRNALHREVLMLYNDHGLSISHIARLLNVDSHYVTYVLQDNGINTVAMKKMYKKIGGNYIRVSS